MTYLYKFTLTGFFNIDYNWRYKDNFLFSPKTKSFSFNQPDEYKLFLTEHSLNKYDTKNSFILHDCLAPALFGNYADEANTPIHNWFYLGQYCNSFKEFMNINKFINEEEKMYLMLKYS